VNILQAYKTWRAWASLKKELGKMDKPLVASKTVWGAVIGGIGAVAAIASQVMAGSMAISDAVPLVLAAVGAVVAVIGQRQATGSAK
jgi:CDP-diglyceride synthetase